MAYFDRDELYPVNRITTGAVGEPGHRVFILQARIDGQAVSFVIEKQQAAALSKSIPRLLAQISNEYPELGEPLVAAHPNLALDEPLDPVFRVGSISLDYDRLHDLVVFTLGDAESEDEDAEEFDEVEVEVEDDEDEPLPELELYLTRGQAVLLGRQAERVVAGGRPSCPNCGQPIDDFGHFCLPPSARALAENGYVQ